MQNLVAASSSFNVHHFIPRLQEQLTVVSPYKRQFLLSWIAVLDSVPDVDMLAYLPRLLQGLMGMLSDANREIRQATHKLLQVRCGS